MSKPLFNVRVATLADADAVTAVLMASYSRLLSEHYDATLLAQALPLMTRANPLLLGSGKYYVADAHGGRIIGCGGWSFERPGTTEVVSDVAHVRHFATEPEWLRCGVARALLSQSIREAELRKIRALEVYSTLPAVNFYQELGFVVINPIDFTLAPGVTLPSVLMKRISKFK